MEWSQHQIHNRSCNPASSPPQPATNRPVHPRSHQKAIRACDTHGHSLSTSPMYLPGTSSGDLRSLQVPKEKPPTSQHQSSGNRQGLKRIDCFATLLSSTILADCNDHQDHKTAQTGSSTRTSSNRTQRLLGGYRSSMSLCLLEDESSNCPLTLGSNCRLVMVGSPDCLPRDR